jgi:hypothetical protein
MVVATSQNLSCFLPYGINNLHGVSSTMSSIGYLALAIEPTLLGAVTVLIWASNKFGRTYQGPPNIAFSALGTAETCCCVKKPTTLAW